MYTSNSPRTQQPIPAAILSAAAQLLRPYAPSLSEQALADAIAEKKVDGPPPVEQLLTRKEAAARLHVSLATLGRMLADGRLKSHHFSRRNVRVSPAEIRNLLERSK